jgi:hypothetical protein
MSGSHYYLISSLPLLRWGSRPPTSSADFLAHCEGQLAEQDLAELTDVSLVPRTAGRTRAERRWIAWDGYLRNQIARGRAHHRHQDAAPFLRDETDAFPTDRKELDEALAQDSPLERERSIDHLRWRRLGDFESGHPFDLDWLVLYRLKLLLLEKWARFDSETGTANFAELVDAGLRQAAEQRVSTE